MKKYLFLAFFFLLYSCKDVKKNQTVYFFEANEEFINSHIDLKPREFIEALDQAHEPFVYFSIGFKPAASDFNYIFDHRSRLNLTGSSNALFYGFLISNDFRSKNEHKRNFSSEIALLRLANPTLLLSDSKAIIAPAKFWVDLSGILKSSQNSMPSLDRLKEMHDSIWLEHGVQKDNYLPLGFELSRFLEQRDYAIFRSHVIGVEESPSQKDFWVLVN
jgi:hypothetical protein